MYFMTHTTQGEGSFPLPLGWIRGDLNTFLFLSSYFAHQFPSLLIFLNSIAMERVVGCYLGLGSPTWQGSCVNYYHWAFVFWELTSAWVSQDLGLVPGSRKSIAYFLYLCHLFNHQLLLSIYENCILNIQRSRRQHGLKAPTVWWGDRQ